MNSRMHEEREPLLVVAERVRASLLPVEPSPAFVQDLRRSLLAMADGKRPRTSLSARHGLLIGAAALGSALPVVGIIAYVVRSRASARAKTPVHR